MVKEARVKQYCWTLSSWDYDNAKKEIACYVSNTDVKPDIKRYSIGKHS